MEGQNFPDKVVGGGRQCVRVLNDAHDEIRSDLGVASFDPHHLADDETEPTGRGYGDALLVGERDHDRFIARAGRWTV